MELITIEELNRRTGIAKQTFYNWIYNGKRYQNDLSGKRLTKGKHYIKPSRRILRFKWEEILKFLEEESEKEIGSELREKNRNFIEID